MLSRLRLVLVLFVITGICAYAFLRPKKYEEKTEPWMEKAIPESLSGYSLLVSSRRDSSVKMDRLTYDTLQPFGIVSRTFKGAKDGRTYEFLVIAGNTRKPFHDPQVCFSAQAWVLQDPKTRTVNIPAIGGNTQVTAMGLSKPGQKAAAMYFYKDPFGWRPAPFYIPIDLTLAKLLMKDRVDGQFFRLIVSPSTTPKDDSPQAKEAALNKDVEDLSTFVNTMFEKLKTNADGRYFVQN